MISQEYKMLLSPFEVNGVKFRNRIVKAPMGMRYADDRDGFVNDRFLAYYEALARGGTAMLLTEAAAVDFPEGATGAKHLRMDDDKFLPGLSDLTRVIHSHGAVTFMQLNHGGPATKQKYSGLQPVGPSAMSEKEVPNPKNNPTRELTIPEIERIIARFAEAAERAQKARFDGVEIHGAHFYLINAFLSRIFNKRQDAYGGSIENRARFAVEILRAVREKVGPDYAVGVRINGAEYGVEGGLTLEETLAMAPMLEAAGADYIHVSAEGYGDYGYFHWPEQSFRPELPGPLGAELDSSRKGAGALVPLGAAVKKVVSVPIITVGRLSPELAEVALQQGKADLVTFGRRLMADPDFPNKLMAGKPEDITPCIACIRGWEKGYLGGSVCCAVNPALGREREFELKPAEKKKKVVIIGGGPSGMEAARVATLRGHDVTICEKESKLGGASRLAAMVNEDLGDDLVLLIQYYRTQMEKLGIKVSLGKEAAPAVIEGLRPDVIIVATGGIPVILKIPGINRRNVVGVADVYRRLKFALRFFGPQTLRKLTKLWMPIGKRVVIIGGGVHGCELAEFLIKRDRKVTIVDSSGKIGEGVVWLIRDKLLKWLAKKGCVMMTGVKYEEVTDKGLVITNKEGKKQVIEADTVIPVLGLKANNAVFEAVKGKAPEVYIIGDSKEPHLLMEAIEDGARIGRAI